MRFSPVHSSNPTLVTHRFSRATRCRPEAWKPSTKIDQILRALLQLLEEPNRAYRLPSLAGLKMLTLDVVTAEDALVGSIAEVYRNDKAAHDREAKHATQKARGLPFLRALQWSRLTRSFQYASG